MSRLSYRLLNGLLVVCALGAVCVGAVGQSSANSGQQSQDSTQNQARFGGLGETLPSKETVKQTVTVTASRTPLSVDATASSVRVLSGEQLRESPGFTLDDRLRQVPGLELYRRTSSLVANPTTQGISLRGLGSTAASRTLALSDEVPMSDPFGGWIHWDEVPRLALQDVEVLRGGASDLYGSSAIGGVINEVPVPAEEPRAEIDGGYGGEQTGFGDGLWVGKLLPHNELNGLAAASVVHTAGYITTAPDVRGPIDIASGVHSESGRVELRHGVVGEDVFLRGNVLNEARANGTPVTVNSTRLWRYAGGLDHPAGGGSVFLRLYGSDQGYRQTFSTVNTARTSEYLNRIQLVPSQEMGGSAQWARTFRSALTMVAGSDVRDVRATDAETTFGSTGASTGTTNITARQRDAGFYGEMLWNKGAWSAALSGRVDNFQTFDVRKLVNATATMITPTSETVFDPRLGLVRRLGAGVSLTGSVFRAFRGPTQNELYRNSQVGSQLTVAPPTNTLESERATGFELGGEVERARLGTVRASYFWTEVNRPITALFVSTNNYQRANLGQIRSQGISVDFVSSPAKWMQVSGGYQLAVATVTKFAPQPALVGLWLPEVARNAGSVQVSVTRRALGTLNLVARESGRVWDDTNNTELLHGYFRLDLFAEHDFGRRFSVYTTAQNLLNRSIDAGRTPLLTQGQPRTALAGLRLHL